MLVRLADDHGVPIERCLHGSGIVPGALADPRSEIQVWQELRVAANLVDHLGQVRGIGLHAGLRHHLPEFGMLGLAMAGSATLREAVDLIQRYGEVSPLLCPVRVEESHGGFHVMFERVDLPGGLPEAMSGFIVDRDTAAMVRISRLLLPRVRLRAAAFDFPAPEHAAQYAPVLGVVPVFDADTTRLTIDPRHVDRPLPQASAVIRELAEAVCADQVRRRRSSAGLTGKVRHILVAHHDGVPAMVDVAAALHLSPRTLRRRLAEEDTTYRELVIQTRRSLAEELLASGTRVGEVATRLGYADTSTFIRAFKAQQGTTPARYAHAAPQV